MQVLRQWLRLRHAYAIPEQADGVCIWAARVEVQEHGYCLIVAELLCDLSPALLVGKVALGVEAHVVGPVRQEEGRSRRGDTHADELARLRSAVATPLGLYRVQALDDLHLEHVAASLHADVRTGTCEQVLAPALREGHEELAGGDRHDIECRVRRVEGDGAGVELGAGVVRCVRLKLLLLRLLGCLCSFVRRSFFLRSVIRLPLLRGVLHLGVTLRGLLHDLLFVLRRHSAH
mmetsp:Transcript_50888/g.152182  ORF Transcript_50888/g.152182 Transcript_50888/m.152182 type:complete len:233 (-) Transcript_50888:55-753(-)